MSIRDFMEAEDFIRFRLQDYSHIDLNDSGWVGCKDAGYPCGLWQLFHYLTVNYSHKKRWNLLEQVSI